MNQNRDMGSWDGLFSKLNDYDVGKQGRYEYSGSESTWESSSLRSLAYDKKDFTMKSSDVFFSPPELESSAYYENNVCDNLSRMSIASSELINDNLEQTEDSYSDYFSNNIKPQQDADSISYDTLLNSDSPERYSTKGNNSFLSSKNVSDYEPVIEASTMMDNDSKRTIQFDVDKRVTEFTQLCDQYSSKFGAQFNFHITAEFIITQILNGVDINLELFEKCLQRHILMAPYKPQNFTTTVAPAFFSKLESRVDVSPNIVPFPWVLDNEPVGKCINPVPFDSKLPKSQDNQPASNYKSKRNLEPKKNKICNAPSESIIKENTQAPSVSISPKEPRSESKLPIGSYREFENVTINDTNSNMTLQEKERSPIVWTHATFLETSFKKGKSKKNIPSSRSSHSSLWGNSTDETRPTAHPQTNNCTSPKNATPKKKTPISNVSYTTKPSKKPFFSSPPDCSFKSQRSSRNKANPEPGEYRSPFDEPVPTRWPSRTTSNPKATTSISSFSSPKPSTEQPVQYLGKLQYSSRDGLLEPLYETPYGHIFDN